MPKLSGKHLSELHLEALTNIIKKNTTNHSDNRPKLAFFLVGDRDDSRIYVDIKKKMCDKIGITYKEYHLPEVVGVNELAEKIDICNRDPLVHGIIIQLPLPDHLPEESLLQLVDPDKDVDGFHSLNIARLVSNQIIDYDDGEGVGDEKIITLVDSNYSRDKEIDVIQKDIVQQHHTQKGFYPCTPKGIVTLLSYYKFSFVKKKAVIVGCGRVGRPLGLMLLSRGMTVSYIDKYTRKTDKIKKIRETDLLVVAVGKRGIVDTNWISNNTVVVDVGIHQVNSKTCGDLILKDLLVREKNGELNELYRTPVPGGVGPMTVCMLLENTIISWLRNITDNQYKNKQIDTPINKKQTIISNILETH